MFVDIHTHHNPRSGVPSVVDVSGGEGRQFDMQLAAASNAMFSAGIHPKSICQNWKAKLAQIEQFANNPKFAGVGECGLDKFADSPRELQEEVFETQLSLAQRIGKPAIIHCVRLYSDVIRLLKKTHFDQPAIFHGYNGNPDITAQLLKLPNAYFSYSASAFAMPETSGSKSLPLIPLSQILTESDCDTAPDYMAIINNIAAKKAVCAASLQQCISENFRRVTHALPELFFI